MAGNGLKDDKGRGAWDMLTRIVEGAEPVMQHEGKPIFYGSKNPDGTPVFTDGPDGGKAMIIQKVLGKYRTKAKEMLSRGDTFPDLRNEYIAKQSRKRMNQVPQIAGGAR